MANKQRVLCFVAIDITFMAIIGLIAYWNRVAVVLTPLNVVVLSLATFRMGRAVAFNEIFEWLRAPFTEVVADSSGAGDSVSPRGTGLRRVIGGLLACPICSGTWSALILFSLVVVLPPFGMYFAYVMAFAGVSEVLHWWSEKNEWSGRNQREQAGTQWLEKNK